MKLSTKELNYIKDFLSWELLMAKKCSQYAAQETIPDFKQMFDETGRLHQQNYEALLQYIHNQDSSPIGGIQ